MKIKGIRLENFRSYHGRNEFNGFDRINVFLGLNGAGKSTVLDGICFALTGACRGTDQGGRGADKLVTRRGVLPGAAAAPDNAKPDPGFQVVLTTDKGEIVRTLGAGPNSKYQETVNRLMGPRKGRNTLAVQVALQPHVFLALPPAEQKALLLNVVGAEIDASAVATQLGELAKHLPPGALESLQMLDAAEKGLRERRPQLKRALDELVVPSPPEVDVKIPAGMTAAQATQAAKAEINSMRRSHQDILTGVRARQTAAASSAAARETMAAKIKKHEGELGRLMSEEEIAARITTLSASLGKSADKSRSNELDCAKAEARLKATQGFREAAQTLLDGQSELGLCPKCLPRLRDILKAYEKEEKALALKVKPRPESASKKKVEEELELMDSAGNEVIRIKRELSGAKERLAELEKTATVPTGDTEQAAKAKDLEAAIEKGESYVGRLQRVVFAGEQAEKIRARRLEIESDLAQVEALIKRIGPGGDVRAGLLGPKLAEFENEVNSMLFSVGWGKIEAKLDAATFSIRMNPPGSEFMLESDMLSASEHYRLSIVLALCIAVRAGLDIVCLDGADILVAQNKEALSQLLQNSRVGQAFVCASTAATPPSAGPDGWSFYSVRKEAGKSVVYPASMATTAA